MNADATQARKKWTPLERAAYHEAGHAVMRYLLGGNAEDVTIATSESGDVSGCQTAKQALFHHDIPPDPEITPELLYLVEKSILHLLSGMVAEKSFAKRNDAALAKYDLDAANNLATYMLNNLAGGAHSPNQCIGWLTDKATILLEAKLYLVEAVASALIKDPALSGAEIEACICKTEGLPEPARVVTLPDSIPGNSEQKPVEAPGPLMVPGVVVQRPRSEVR